MSPNPDSGAAQLYEVLVRRTQSEDNVLGLILAGSRGAGIFVTDRSDFDAYVILRSPHAGWKAGHGEPVEVWPMTIDEFRRHALVGEPDAWNRPRSSTHEWRSTSWKETSTDSSSRSGA